ncbi:hypothetical protein BD779DRAFT_1677198 [Infundibulicybe gibba]|nr:hypothetical protein BD779DRAFT_1677198 [Infundibulicybe gibba]
MTKQQNEATFTGPRATLTRHKTCPSCACTCAPSETSPTRPAPLPQPELAITSPGCAVMGVKPINRESLEAWDDLAEPADDEWIEVIDEWRRGIDDTWDKEWEEDMARDEELRAEQRVRVEMLHDRIDARVKARTKKMQAIQTISLAHLPTPPATSASVPIFLPRLSPHLFPRKKGPRAPDPGAHLLFSPRGSPIARDAVLQERDRTRDELIRSNEAMDAIITASAERNAKLREILVAFEQVRKAQKMEARLLSAEEKVREWMLQTEMRERERALGWMLWTGGRTQEWVLRTEERVREWILRAEEVTREERARDKKPRSRVEKWIESVRGAFKICTRVREILTTSEQARKARERGDRLLQPEDRRREGALRAEERAREEKLRVQGKAQVEMLVDLVRVWEKMWRVEGGVLGEKLRAVRERRAQDEMLQETPEKTQVQTDPMVAPNLETIQLERILADWNGSWEMTLPVEKTAG